MIETKGVLTLQSDLAKKSVYSVLAGALGTVILTGFIASLVSMAQAGRYLPWIIGFNAMLSGYMLLEKTRQRFKHKRLSAAGAGFSAAVLACVILNAVFFSATGMLLTPAAMLFQLLVIAIGCSLLGGILAIKYFNLK